MLFNIGFTSGAGGVNNPGSIDFLCFLVVRTTSFFLVTVSEME